ncbi:MAG: undecaprenyldiphospho-muramoylpentapeptide beta-N-acetylglucosaminyltransferase [Alphaproteobacteria bacterium]|nr:undecaprenyldiphospho-muramoylpentapeptide beta-N-acetylglucosaminyltransferase [Alphaproteobacteria bacterium]
MTSDGNRQPPASSDNAPVLLSSGGTGGHMFPAFALAGELKARGIPVALVTDARGTKYQSQYPDIPFHVVRAETLRAGLVAKLRMVAELLIGTGQAFAMLLKMKPRVVVGFGGYPSFPAVLAAQALRIPTVLHEQNAVLGRANKLVAAGATKIALSLPDVAALPEGWRGKAIVTGNPVRAEIAAVGQQAFVPPTDTFNILVLGGSQGASVFSSVVPEAIGLLPADLKKKVRVVQQCRAADIADARHAYDLLGINARLETFITDVPAQLAACHLLIGRSGASTVTEAAVAGRPAIFVPYPHHKDQQQKVNAEVLVRANAALLAEEKTLTPQMLAKELENLMQHPALLGSMAEAARKTLPADASKRLADAILGL